MNIPLELGGKIKKPEFKIFYFDPINNNIEENIAHVYLYKHKYKSNNFYEIGMEFKIQLYDKKASDPSYYIDFYMKGFKKYQLYLMEK